MSEIRTTEGTRLKTDKDGDVWLEDDNNDEACIILKNAEIPEVIAFLLGVEVKV